MNITVSPNPAAPGATVTICYYLIPSGETRTVKVTWFLNGGLEEWEPILLSSDAPCQTRIVPNDAKSALLEDDDGYADDVTLTIVP